MRVPVQPLKMPPPLVVVELLFRMELETVRVPALLNAPPLPVVIWAPETVTPEMVRLPAALIVKILKLPWLASMVSEEAPGPVMESEPAPDVAAIVGSADPREIVLLPFVNSEAAKTISSLALVALASIIACRSEPAPKSAAVVTVLIDSICRGSSDSREICWAGRLERRRRVGEKRE